jgi:ATP-dependent Lon protease
VSILTSLTSALSGRPVHRDIAMTGEVTLHGSVLPIGGVREKLLAAYRMNITNILLPRENEKDLEEIDPEILGKMNIKLIGNVDEALDIVLQNPKKMRLAI